MSSIVLNVLDHTNCVRLTQTLLHFVWQGLVIGLCAGILAWLFRTATPRVRYGIHAVSLTLMAVCVPISFTWTEATEVSSTRSVRFRFAAGEQTIPRRIATDVSLPTETKSESSATNPGPTPVAGQFDVFPAAFESSLAEILRRAAPYTTLAYFVGLALMLIRLCCALWGGHRLRRSGTPIRDPQLLSELRQHARLIGLKLVPVVAYCERIAIPVVVGILRPIILLPASVVTGLDPAQLHIILVHEMTHIRRFDLLVNLLQRVLETLLFFHPAVWYVSRQLSIEREHCCDDAVVQAGFERIQYASTLVRVAELCISTRSPAFDTQLATLAANGSNATQLKRRVLRLLGEHQRLRLTRADSVTLILVAGLIVGILTGVWRQAAAADQGPPSQPAVAMEKEFEGQRWALRQSQDDYAKRDDHFKKQTEPSDRRIKDPTNEAATKPQRSEFSGSIVDASGKPVVGAQIWAHKPYFDVWKSVAVSDANGQFQVTLESAVAAEPTSEPAPQIQIAATAEGLGIDWVSFKPDKVPSKITFTLREDVPVEGRLVNSEGRPTVGAIVRILHVVPGDVSHIKVFKGDGSGVWLFPPRDALPTGGPLTSSTVTDQEGRFRFSGLGKERWVRLEVEGPGLAIARLGIVTRTPPADVHANAAIAVREPRRQSDYYTHFTHVAVPARTLRGTVLDANTQAPIAGVEVTLASILGHKYQTDSAGRFEILGCPKGKDYEVKIAPDRAPYFTQIVRTPDDGGQDPVEVRVAMKPGMIVRGSVSTSDNRPARGASVVYNPIYPNEHSISFDKHQANPLSRAMVRDDGTYEIAVHPGFGALAVDWKRDTVPCARIDRSEVEIVLGRKLERPHSESNDVTYLMTANRESQGIMSLSDYKALRMVNPKGPQDVAAPIDFRLAAGHERRGVIVDANNQPVQNATITGLLDTMQVAELDTAEVTVLALQPKRERWLLIYQKERQLGAAITINGSDEGMLTIRLLPCSTVTGRLLDKNRKPLEGLSAGSLIQMRKGTDLTTGFWVSQPTDSEGRFRISGLIPNCPIAFRIEQINWYLRRIDRAHGI